MSAGYRATLVGEVFKPDGTMMARQENVWEDMDYEDVVVLEKAQVKATEYLHKAADEKDEKAKKKG